MPGAYATSSSTDASPQAAAHEEDARHHATTVSQVPKPAVTASPTPPLATSGFNPDMAAKDLKTAGPRLHDDCLDTDLPSPRLRSSRTWRGRGTEMLSAERERNKPLSLLDLPVDVLREIVREVTHTNDLTSLALCHSALHRLAIPHIYSRFDIVWPDTSTHAEPRSGVDALTYGLATLVMAEEIFGEAPSQRKDRGNRSVPSGKGRATETMVRRRRGNHYAQYTKKFSLGNGPADWVQEYLITKEGGKMLGTLVALAVARMRSLETFVWDMPTGILRDVWLALSSLAERDDERDCRLEKVWVRWHDNSPTDSSHQPPFVPPPPPLQPSGNGLLPIGHASQLRAVDLDRVERPSFSVLPPLRSVSVLDIDELAYLDEMAVLIGNSLTKLRELRVGIARHALSREWVTVWEGEELQQVDYNNPTAGWVTLGEKRLGGILGTLTGFVHDMRKPKLALPDRTRRMSPVRTAANTGHSPARPASANPVADTADSWSVIAESGPEENAAAQTLQISPHLPETDSSLGDDPLIASSRAASPQPPATPEEVLPAPEALSSLRIDTTPPPILPEEPARRLNNRLELESLELERVPLSIAVLQQTIDWSKLNTLTILHCQNQETLWKTLRRSFAPTPKSPTYPATRRTPTSTPKKGSRSSLPAADLELVYPLNLKRIHTNTVSPALISFLKETLAPNSLEVLFLQEARSYPSTVTIEAIFKGPMRRHRTSLKKLLIDSSEKAPDGAPTGSSRWRKWILNREILAFICSGKMPRLRELGMAVEYRDWVSGRIENSTGPEPSLTLICSISFCNTCPRSPISARSTSPS